MNDYFLIILMGQWPAEIMAEFRAHRLPRLERPRMTCWVNRILHSFFPSGKTSIVNRAPAVDERTSA